MKNVLQGVSEIISRNTIVSLQAILTDGWTYRHADAIMIKNIYCNIWNCLFIYYIACVFIPIVGYEHSMFIQVY